MHIKKSKKNLCILLFFNLNRTIMFLKLILLILSLLILRTFTTITKNLNTNSIYRTLILLI